MTYAVHYEQNNAARKPRGSLESATAITAPLTPKGSTFRASTAPLQTWDVDTPSKLNESLEETINRSHGDEPFQSFSVRLYALGSGYSSC